MFYNRKIYQDLKSHLSQKPVTVLTGMRRVGKTTLVKKLLSEIASDNKAYFDLERLDQRDIFKEKNYEAVVLALQKQGWSFKKKLYLVLDEIQLAPNLVSVVKYLYDNYKIKFIVTGSSSFYLKNLFTESLAGRKKIFELFPLDFGEFLTFKAISFKVTPFRELSGAKFHQAEYNRLKSLYEEFVDWGGFPEVVLAKSQQTKKDFLSDIISSYINIDVAALSDFRRQQDFYALMKMLASRIGSRLDYVKLSQLTGISRPTLMDYLEFLEKTYIIYRLPVFTKRLDKEIVKARKLYFCDTGLVNILSQTSSGQQFENVVFNQLRHYGELRYYALKTGREIDFVLNRKIGIEVKEKPTISDQKNLKELSKLAGLRKQCLVGRQSSPKFQDYLWAGEMR